MSPADAFSAGLFIGTIVTAIVCLIAAHLGERPSVRIASNAESTGKCVLFVDAAYISQDEAEGLAKAIDGTTAPTIARIHELPAGVRISDVVVAVHL